MRIQSPRARALPMALATALVFAVGCKTDAPAAAPPAQSDDTAAKPPPSPAPEAKPPAPALPVEPSPAEGSDGGHGRDRSGARMDTDGDGVISDEERATALRGRAEAMRKRLDTNGDGKLTPDELAGARGRMRFDDPAALDTNHDGDISADELAAGLKARSDLRRGQRAGGSGSSATP